jgi:hypothetical protein
VNAVFAAHNRSVCVVRADKEAETRKSVGGLDHHEKQKGKKKKEKKKKKKKRTCSVGVTAVMVTAHASLVFYQTFLGRERNIACHQAPGVSV